MPLNDFNIDSRLGQGSYANVFKVTRKSTIKTYALKKVDMTGLNPKELANALNEIRLLASFNHPRIVGVYEIFIEDPGDLCIVMEYCGYQDLHQKIKRYIHRKEYIDERIIWVYMIQILEGLKALHDKGVLHRDLKPANCFLASDGSVKIGDFNVSKVVQEGINASTVIGTPFYMAPEIWQKRTYSYAADIWSLGCTIYELAALRPPILAANMLDLQAKVPRGEYDPLPAVYSRGLAAVVDRMLRPDPEQRYSAAELLNLPAVQACYVLVKNKLPAGEIPLRTGDQTVLTPLDPETVASLPLGALADRLPGPCYPEDPAYLSKIPQEPLSPTDGSRVPALGAMSFSSPPTERAFASPKSSHPFSSQVATAASHAEGPLESARPPKVDIPHSVSPRAGGPTILAPLSPARSDANTPRASPSVSPIPASPCPASLNALKSSPLMKGGSRGGRSDGIGIDEEGVTTLKAMSPGGGRRLQPLHADASSDGEKTLTLGQGTLTVRVGGAISPMERTLSNSPKRESFSPKRDAPAFERPKVSDIGGGSAGSPTFLQKQGSVRQALSAAKDLVGPARQEGAEEGLEVADFA